MVCYGYQRIGKTVQDSYHNQVMGYCNYFILYLTNAQQMDSLFLAISWHNGKQSFFPCSDHYFFDLEDNIFSIKIYLNFLFLLFI